MAAPATTDEFLDLIRKSGVAEEKRFDAWLAKAKAAGLPAKATEAAGLLVRDGILTTFQAEQILQGKWKRFTIGKYKVLEKLGSGGMGSVYLCEHKLMRRRVAVKVLPSAKANDEAALGRFYREARAVAALDHPNIVHAYDIDQDETLHFLVMEYVDGASLQDIVKKAGPLDIHRACHYIHQSALGLEHASQAGLIHRDIKPGNILVDRTGVVKILDMGLARFFNDEDDMLTKKFDENVLGTADYLAPEQAIDSHEVDIRADIYSLGATFYFILTGRTAFGEGTVAQKLLWHQNRQPKPVTEFRPEVPADLAAIISKMMAKEKTQRYQTPAEVAAALEPFVQGAIGPPPDSEMPQLSLAATGPAPSMEAADTAIVKTPPPAAPRALQGMSSRTQQTKPPSDAARSAPAPSSAGRLATPPPPTKTSPTPPGRLAASAPVSPAPKSAPKPAAAPPPPRPVPPPSSVNRIEAIQSVSPPQAVQIAASPAAVEEEDAPWESLGSVDTEDPSAKADTAPNRSSRSITKIAPVKNPRRAWLVFTLIGVGALLVVAGLLVYVFLNTDRPTTAARRPLLVGKETMGANTYRSVLQALRAAQPGDVIQLVDPEHAEHLVLEHRMTDVTTDVTIEAAPGKDVVWKTDRADESTPILKLQNARNLKIKGKGLTFDGTITAKKKLKDLIVLNFKCAGLAIEDATFQGFSRSAVNVVNVWGSEKSPVRLANLNVLGASADQPLAAILLEANPDVIDTPYNDFLDISDLHAEGVKEAIKNSDPALGKHVVRPK